MADEPVLLMFHGAGGAGGPAERMVTRARALAGRRSIARALAAGFGRAIVATDAPDAFAGLGAAVVVEADPPGRFALRTRVADLMKRYRIERPAVMGGGSLPLLDEDAFHAIAAVLDGPPGRLATNNLYSGDITGWTPAEALERTAAFERDNALPRRLRDDAGLEPVVLPRTTATQFDLDTPVDLAVLALHPGSGDLGAELVEGAPLLLERLRTLMALFRDRDAEIVVAGRTGSATWQYLETQTACRTRVFSEERGLAVAGPDHRGRSILGQLIEAVGVQGFFARLAELGEAAVIDTRVIEAHFGMAWGREDRFQADLLAAEAIGDPFLRELTAGGRGCAIPVVLGGHSLVSGGLMALVDAAWDGIENGRAS